MLEFMMQCHIAHIERQLKEADENYINLKKKYDNSNKYSNSQNIFSILWNSTKNFWYRFYTVRPNLNVGLAILKDELNEFYAEAVKILNKTDEKDTRKKLTEEAADVIVTVQYCLMAAGLSLSDIETAMNNVALKNDAKTLDTHKVDGESGKIIRKSIE